VGRRPPALVAVAGLVMASVVAACSGGGSDESGGSGDGASGPPSAEELARQGGDATVEIEGSMAFGQPVPGLSSAQGRTFAVGNNFFNDNWVTAPASTAARDGLGPLFNAQSCSSCHFRDGRAQPPAADDDPERGLLLRLSVAGGAGSDAGGDPGPHPALGDQLQDRAIRGVPPEGRVRITPVEHPGTLDDGTPYTLVEPRYEIVDEAGEPVAVVGEDVVVSPRIAPAMFGVGLLEGVPDEVLFDLEDPDDEDGDGVSGRVHVVEDPSGSGEAVGRFGWKAAVPTVEDQNARAFLADIGITSSGRPDQPCTADELAAECGAAPTGGDPEIEDERLDQVTFYSRTLAVPARRDAGSGGTARGQEVFDDVGCASCHVGELRTGPSDIEALDEQVIRPYTDLLLHDMGPGLADGRPDGDASGREWRTPPLWGVGLVETVNGHTRFLHDGRARDMTEAILWHGGEAGEARDRFAALPAEDRAAVLAFLGSL
jgi:CxxC motif-containing protein (DUF1111 family)